MLKKFFSFYKTMGVLISLGTIVGMVYGGLTVLDNRYASAQDVKTVSTLIFEMRESQNRIEKKLDKKIISDEINNREGRIWEIRSKFDGKKMPTFVSSEINQLQSEINQLKIDLDELNKAK